MRRSAMQCGRRNLTSLLFYVKNASTSNGRVLHNNFGYSDGRRRYKASHGKSIEWRAVWFTIWSFCLASPQCSSWCICEVGDYISKDLFWMPRGGWKRKAILDRCNCRYSVWILLWQTPANLVVFKVSGNVHVPQTSRSPETTVARIK
jgi:hypothetical protein